MNRPGDCRPGPGPPVQQAGSVAAPTCPRLRIKMRGASRKVAPVADRIVGHDQDFRIARKRRDTVQVAAGKVDPHIPLAVLASQRCLERGPVQPAITAHFAQFLPQIMHCRLARRHGSVRRGRGRVCHPRCDLGILGKPSRPDCSRRASRGGPPWARMSRKDPHPAVAPVSVVMTAANSWTAASVVPSLSACRSRCHGLPATGWSSEGRMPISPVALPRTTSGALAAARNGRSRRSGSPRRDDPSRPDPAGPAAPRRVRAPSPRMPATNASRHRASWAASGTTRTSRDGADAILVRPAMLNRPAPAPPPARRGASARRYNPPCRHERGGAR